MNELALPFLTRDMLKFEQGSTFELRIKYRSFVSLDVFVRGATRSGFFSYRLSMTANPNEQTQDFSLNDIPVWISITTNPTIVTHGSVYVSANLAINNDVAYQLCSGYIFDSKSLSWPSSSLGSTVPQHFGNFTTLTDPAPAAGANFSFGTNAYSVVKINGIRFSITTSATVANRVVHIVFQPVAGSSFQVFSSVNQTAGTTRVYHVLPVFGLGSYSDDNDIIIPMPANIILNGDSVVSSEITNLQAGDQLSDVQFFVERWFGYAE